MTNEQIEQAAIDWRGYSESAYTTDAFKAGAEWAKRQMVDNVCKWLEEQFYYSNLMEGVRKIPELEREFEAMLNENKE